MKQPVDPNQPAKQHLSMQAFIFSPWIIWFQPSEEDILFYFLEQHAYYIFYETKHGYSGALNKFSKHNLYAASADRSIFVCKGNEKEKGLD